MLQRGVSGRQLVRTQWHDVCADEDAHVRSVLKVPKVRLGGAALHVQIRPDWNSSCTRNVYIAVRQAKAGDALLPRAKYDGKVRMHAQACMALLLCVNAFRPALIFCPTCVCVGGGGTAGHEVPALRIYMRACRRTSTLWTGTWTTASRS